MRLATRVTDDRGFTLIELLVVALIVGVLAAIALLSITEQNVKAQDAEAKSNARSIIAVVEACNAVHDDYRDCESDDVPGIRDAGIALGGGRGQVVVTSDQRRSFVIASRSRSGNVFVLSRTDGGGADRTCTVAAGGEKGGCSQAPVGTW
jgi:type IV pilus assembly protein PilA